MFASIISDIKLFSGPRLHGILQTLMKEKKIWSVHGIWMKVKKFVLMKKMASYAVICKWVTHLFW